MKKMLLILCFINFLHADLMEQGKGVVSFKGGIVSVHEDNYIIAGGNIGWLLIDGLKLGIGYERWFDRVPNVDKLSLDLVYYLPISERVRPYLGGFVANNYLDSVDAGVSEGFKIGILFSSEVASVGLEWNQEYYEKCIFGCERAYPMVVLGIGF